MLGGQDGELPMSFEDRDDASAPLLWNWGPKPSRCGRETEFKPVQLQLPLGAEAWRESPVGKSDLLDRELPNFLTMIGVSEPALVARALIDEFRSVSGMLSASTMRIRALVGGRTAAAIQSARDLMKAAMLERVMEAPAVPRSAALIDFLTAEIGFLEQECLLSLYVNSGLRLMRIETIAEGDSGQVLLHARKIIACGLVIGAAGYILVHNHPSGIPEPSNADIAATAHVRRLSAELGLQLVDHLIVARGRVGSIEDHWREARWRQGEPAGADAESSGLDVSGEFR